MSDSLRNQNQKEFLKRALSKRVFSHAYLFTGADPEKKAAARWFAEEILGAKPGFNPDLIWLDREKLKIEDVRNLIGQLSLKPYDGEYKVAVIENFESISAEGASSILKTLEEPSPSTILILLANSREYLLPTIVSRVQTLEFNDFVFNPAKLDAEQKTALSSYENLRGCKIGPRLAAVKEFSDFESIELQKFFATWLAGEQQELRSGQASRFKNAKLLCEAISGLDRNFNKKLVLEKLFLNLV